MVYFYDYLDELVLHNILINLELNNIYILLNVCKKLNSYLDDNLLWKQIYKKKIQKYNYVYQKDDIAGNNYKIETCRVLYNNYLKENFVMNRLKNKYKIIIYNKVCKCLVRSINRLKSNITKLSLSKIIKLLRFNKLNTNIDLNEYNWYNPEIRRCEILLLTYNLSLLHKSYKIYILEKTKQKKEEYIYFLEKYHINTYYHSKYRISNILYQLLKNYWFVYNNDDIYMKLRIFKKYKEDIAILTTNEYSIKIYKDGLISAIYVYYQYGKNIKNISEIVLDFDGYIQYHVDYYKLPDTKNILFLAKYLKKINQLYRLFGLIRYNINYIDTRIII